MPTNRTLRSAIGPLVVGIGIALAVPAAAFATPDPDLRSQWALAETGAIGAREAWTQSRGNSVLVAVLDTGVQVDHPDLAANVWTNPREVAGNGRDDDDNGFVDDVHGANMFDLSGDVVDDNGHGTHNAGIIAALQGNGIGGSGLAPEARILPVKVLDASMRGNSDVLSRGIRYAVDAGAKIINVSLNSDGDAPAVTDAVRYAGEHGAVVVASAGNSGRDIDVLPSYPASLPDPAILSVAADTADGRLRANSNTGIRSVDISAPGELIAATTRASGYQLRSGTSAAAPFASASLALLSAARPDLQMPALRSAIIDTSRQSASLGSVLAGGRLDVGAAMHRVVPEQEWKGPVAAPTLRLRTKSAARAGTRATVRWTATGTRKVRRWRVSLNGRVFKTVSATTARASRHIARAGLHRWRVVGFDDNARKIVARHLTFRIHRRR